MISKQELARMIDHTNLKADANSFDMKKLCDEAIHYNFAMVAINSGQSKLCAELLNGTNIHVGAAIGFPLGQQSIKTKVFETKDAIENGANEIDYVINISKLKDKDYEYIEEEMKQIVHICKDNNVVSKVIFENCYLDKDEIIKLCEIALKVKPDYIKTSTGFGIYGARLEDVKLMKSIVEDEIKVKAAGGIKDLKSALEFIDAGASRIGTSSGVKIIEEYEKLIND